jgi:hypothetical protein
MGTGIDYSNFCPDRTTLSEFCGSALPLTSANGITEHGTPHNKYNDTGHCHLYVYSDAISGATTTLSIVTTNQITPTFAAIGPLCQNSAAPALPLTSNNGIMEPNPYNKYSDT